MILNAVIWLVSGIFNIYTALIHEVKSIGKLKGQHYSHIFINQIHRIFRVDATAET